MSLSANGVSLLSQVDYFVFGEPSGWTQGNGHTYRRDYDRDRTRCTDNPAPWFIEKEATVFICAAKRRDGRCDWYRATLRNAGWEVVLERPNAGCVLSF